MSNAIRCVAAALACAFLAACAGPRTSTSGGRVGKPPEGPQAMTKVRVGYCGLARPIVAAFRRSSLEKYWRAMEDEIEEPLRKVIESDHLARDALASLEHDVLKQHDWTLTRFTVRLLRELQAEDLPSARTLLRNEAYVKHALSDAMWDGLNGWRVVQYVRPEVLEILEWLDDVSAARAEVEGEREDEQGSASGSSLMAEAQRVTDRLFEAARQLEPYSVGSPCQPPVDPVALAYRGSGAR